MLARSLTSVIGSDSLIVAFRKERVEYMRDILTALSLPVNENHIIQVIIQYYICMISLPLWF